MLDEYLVHECQLITTTRNVWGDYVRSSGTTLSCRWRNIPTVERNTHRENNNADSMVWFAADAPVVIGSILLFNNVFYQVERFIDAQRLGDSDVQFLKTEVKVLDIAIS